MSARAAILAALSGASPPPAGLAGEAEALLAGLEHPPIDVSDAPALFLDRLAVPSIGASYAVVPALADVPAAVADYLASHAAEPALYLPPDPRLRGCDWNGLRLLDTCPVDGGAVLAFARFGVAETGTLVFDTAPDAPMLPNFLALHHIVAVERGTILRWLEDVPPSPAPGPRTRYWVTGVSGTTDIEGQYVRGAHGPRFLHVLLLG